MGTMPRDQRKREDRYFLDVGSATSTGRYTHGSSVCPATQEGRGGRVKWVGSLFWRSFFQNPMVPLHGKNLGFEPKSVWGQN